MKRIVVSLFLFLTINNLKAQISNQIYTNKYNSNEHIEHVIKKYIVGDINNDGIIDTATVIFDSLYWLIALLC